MALSNTNVDNEGENEEMSIDLYLKSINIRLQARELKLLKDEGIQTKLSFL